MLTTSVKLHTLPLSNYKTYLFTVLFVIGNLLFPQLVHLVPQGGFIFLPIYFFTLIAAYKYGIHVGLLTAVLSPVLNNLLFGMPPAFMLSVILTKSVMLAIFAALASNYFKKVSFPGIILAVLAYQLFGSLAEWLLLQDFNKALQDIRIGFPGILLQIFGGFLMLKLIEKQ